MYKRNFIITLFLCLLIPFIIFLYLNYLVSHSLQIKDKGYYDKTFYSNNIRYQIVAITENVDYDSVILGSSMLMNSSGQELQKLLGGKWVNFAFAGANFYERNIVQDYIFKNKEIKNIYYSLDPNYMLSQFTKINDNGLWELLLNDNLFDNFLLAYNIKFISRNNKFALKRYNENEKADIAFFDKPSEWMSKPGELKGFNGIKSWVENKYAHNLEEVLFKKVPKALENKNTLSTKVKNNEDLLNRAINYIENNVLVHAKNNPETNFYYLVIPYSRLWFSLELHLDPQKYALYQSILLYLTDTAEKYPNIKLYAFENESFLDDFYNYNDTTHYHADINSLMAQSVAEEKNQLTKDNIKDYIAISEGLAREFDLQKLYDESLEYLNAQ